jgi:hypothetical protein
MTSLGRARAAARRGLLRASVLGVLLLGVCPAHATLRRLAVDAGARTPALVAYLAAEGGIAVVSVAEAELRVVLREAGATWTLDIRDRHGVRVLRRDFGAAGGEQAALRVTAVLIERALAAVPLAPVLPAPPSVSASAVSSSTVVDPRQLGAVRALPAVPVSPTAASLIASASALPAGSSTTARATRERRPTPADDTPDAPRLGWLRPATTTTRAREARSDSTLAMTEGPVAPALASSTDLPAAAVDVASPSVARDQTPSSPTAPSVAEAPASVPSGAEAPATAPTVAEAPVSAPDPALVVADEASTLAARGAPARAPEEPSALAADAGRWRLVASGAARWWRSPGDLPQIGFGLGAEHAVGPLVLGGAARLAGLPCCARDTTEVRAEILELGLAGYGLLPLLSTDGGLATVHVAAELEGALLRGEGQRVVTGASPATVADLLGASVSVGVGPALELALTSAIGLRLRVLVRVSLVSYEAGLGPGEDPIHSGWIHPYIDLALPLGI